MPASKAEEKAALKAKMLALQQELSKLKDQPAATSVVAGSNGSPRAAPATPAAAASAKQPSRLSAPPPAAAQPKPPVEPKASTQPQSGRAALDAAKAKAQAAAASAPF